MSLIYVATVMRRRVIENGVIATIAVNGTRCGGIMLPYYVGRDAQFLVIETSEGYRPLLTSELGISNEEEVESKPRRRKKTNAETDSDLAI